MRTPPHAVAMGTGAQHTAISSRMRYVEGFEEGWSMHMVTDFVGESLTGRGGARHVDGDGGVRHGDGDARRGGGDGGRISLESL